MALYKRTTFIINPKFQYKFTFIVCSIVIIASLIYPFTIYDLYEKIMLLDPNSSENLEESRNKLLIILTALQFTFIGLVAIVCIFISHKIAGPMYKLSTHLQSIASGGEVKDVYFRDGDNFQEIAEDANAAINYLQEKRESDFEYLEEVSAYISNLSLVIPEDKKPVLHEILSRLSEIRGHR